MNAALAVLQLALVLAASYLLAHVALPAAVKLVGRVFGFAMTRSPITEKRLRRFRAIRRGHWAFVTITTAFAATFFLELYANNKPLYIRYGDHARFPACAEWANQWVPFIALDARVPAKEFGQSGEGDLDARSYARWVRDPSTLAAEAARVEVDIAADATRYRSVLATQAEARGLPYDPRSPLPQPKLDEFQGRRDAAARKMALATEFAAGKGSIWMPVLPYSPREQLLDLPGAPPHKPFQKDLPILGTDAEGKDVMAQLLYGFRTSFSFALVVALAGNLIGIVAGALMGYYGGWIDIGLQRFIEIWASIPFLFVMMIIANIVQPGFWLLAAILIVLAAWLHITYTVRGEFYRERARDYVQAARALGLTDRRIILRHILPNSLVPVVTYLPFEIVGFISALVSLDFLGFGLPPGTPSWGGLLRQGADNIVNYPHLTVIPVLAFAATLFCVVTIGEAVREAFDPKVYARLR